MEPKPGVQTSEFWGKSAVQLITLGITAYTAYTGHAVTPEQQSQAIQIGLAIVAGLEGAYAVSRGIVKSKTQGGL